MGSGDTPLGTVKSFSERAEIMGSATMILSVGNNGLVISFSFFFSVSYTDSMVVIFNRAAPAPDKALLNISKKTTTLKKSVKPESLFSDIPMRSLPLPSTSSSSTSSSTLSKEGLIPLGLEPPPKRRAGFAPIKSAALVTAENIASASSSMNGSSNGGSGLIIPVKRKAGFEPIGAPVNKK